MAIMHQTTLYGTTLEEGKYIPTTNTHRLVFIDQDNPNQAFAIDEQSVFKNILAIGGPGSGKTNVFYQMFAQIQKWNQNSYDGVNLIFDTKGDYISHPGFYHSYDYIISNDSTYRDQSVTWNLFDEVLADGYEPENYEPNARELAASLFKGRENTNQPFFTLAPRDIFASMIIFFIRRNHEDPIRWKNTLNNEKFISHILKMDATDFQNAFSFYEDMHGLISYLGDGKSNQALGVLGELRSMIYDLFQGVFVQKPTTKNPSFSMRKAIREKGGRNIFLLYDLAIGESLNPIYSLLVDLALKEALSSHSNGHTHLFLDELNLVPYASHLENAVNFGRSKKVGVVAGLQSINQIYANYGEQKGQAILGGFANVIALQTNDYTSREYVSRLFGPNIVAYRYQNSSQMTVDRERDGQTVEQWHIQQLQPGHAVVGLATQPQPFLFYFQKD